ncbi:MAG: OB-fold nucleic acid binding domain-containing protein [Chromatiales bacterium]|nr:OB-fold nucleic acid binding domain-containing protein [Chromatiales bacterium]
MPGQPTAPGVLTLRFFHFSGAQQQSLARGARLRCFGEVRPGPAGLEMVHPEYRKLAGRRRRAAAGEQR